MGKIIVGQSKQNVYEAGSLSLVKGNEKSGDGTLRNIYTDEEKEKIVNALVSTLPKERITAALRSAGLNEEAELYEKKFADEEKQKRREIRLKEILALPEEEQLTLLLAEGYDEEAKELSERLSAAQEKTDEGTGEENEGEEVPADGTTSELTDEGAADAGIQEAPEAPVDQEKKKVGRPKKDSQ